METPKGLKGLNTPPPPDEQALWRHFSATYLAIRLGLALLAFAFPLVLWAWGAWAHDLARQPSLSAYFWAAATLHDCAAFPMRSLLVGMLFAIAAGLYAYKGLTDLENWLLNLAALCAVTVALVPERLPKMGEPASQRVRDLKALCPAIGNWADVGQADPPYHYIAAIGLFVLLFIVAWFCAGKSLDYLPPGTRLGKKTFLWLYRLIALMMPIVGIAGGLKVYLAGGEETVALFMLEAGEIWLFALYWGLKTYEMSLTKLQKDPAQAVRHAEQSGTRVAMADEARAAGKA
ncbi:hypothetical protein LZ009_06605 [Ramlibacter sp. XY19]|uniref:hypothetical protein n=1 Tax=Ramlibacter paludis TaxID=2908000 RepID=UPI0023DC671A|nr:hypothetical protein [Ramlibacter paludis]MCG2592451.1 hypothetical protein [Ramlibacter paludis]